MENDKIKVKKATGFNAIDLLIILFIAALTGAALYYFTNSSRNDADCEVVYTVYVQQIKNELRDSLRLIKPGDEVIDTVHNIPIGRIVDVEIKDYFATVTDKDSGVMRKEPYPGYSEVTLTIKADAKETRESYEINKYKIAVGVQVHFKAGKITSMGYCRSLIPSNIAGPVQTTADLTAES